MKNDQVEKRITRVDGEELEGLINMDEYVVEDGVVRVPGRDRDVPVRNGVKVVPEIGAIYKISRDSKTFKTLKDWYTLKQVKEMTVIRTDAAGQEFEREIWTNVECARNTTPAYDASSPTTAQIAVLFLPEDIIPVGVGG